MRILVVEDEHRIAESIKKGLEQETYAVDLAFDGQSGVDMATSENYDLIILDRLLPKMDGTEVCRWLRKENYHTPILMLTALGQISDKIDGLDIGADDYMSKPFSFDELLARVRALLRRPVRTLGVVLVAGDLELDTVNREVRRKGEVVILSNREFSVLEYLMRNAGKILSKDQIISQVWDFRADVLPNTVEANIRNIRNKIEKPFGNGAIIRTIRGFGYKIEKNV